MASRRRAREFALQALYQWDLVKSDPQSTLNGLWEGLLEDEGLDDCRPPESEEGEGGGKVRFSRNWPPK